MAKYAAVETEETLVPNYGPEWVKAYNLALVNTPEHPDGMSYPKHRRKGYIFNRHYTPFTPLHSLVWLQMVVHALNLERPIATFVFSNDRLARLCHIGTTQLNVVMGGLQALGLVTRSHRGLTRTMMTFLHLHPLPFNEARASRKRRKPDSVPTPYEKNEESIEEVAGILEGVLKRLDKKGVLPKGKAGKYKLLVALRDCFAQARARYKEDEEVVRVFIYTLSRLFLEGGLPIETRLAEALLDSPDFCLMLPESYAEILDFWERNPLLIQEVKGDVAS